MLKTLTALFLTLVVLVLAATGGAIYLFYHFGRGLPDYQQLADYESPTVTRVWIGSRRMTRSPRSISLNDSSILASEVSS